MADNENKRLNLVIPMELFDKFQEYSKAEYKSTTGKITDWMVEYVTDRENKARNIKEFRETVNRLFVIVKNIADIQSQTHLVKMLNRYIDLHTQLFSNPALAVSFAFIGEVISLENDVRSSEGVEYIPF